MLSPKFISKLKSNCNLLLIQVITLIFFSIFTLNNAHAAGAVYSIPGWSGSDPGEPATPYFYTHMWVGTATNTTLFVPTVTVYYDSLVGYVGYRGSLTLGITGNNCDYIGADRFCARMAGININGNNFACDSTGNSCTNNSSNSGCEPTSCSISYENDVDTDIQTCSIPSTYTVLGGDSQSYNSTYNCNDGGFYSLCCPGCRNICAQRLCVYQDPAASDDPAEQCDDIIDCMGGDSNSWAPSNALMPYFENEQVAYVSIWGDNIYFNNVGGSPIGCVDVPLGPYPPPYCDPMIGSTPVVSTMDICNYSPQYENDTGGTGNYEQVSTSNDICELSTAAGIPTTSAPVYNTFEQPIIRLFFNNALNICSSTYTIPVPPPSPGDDTCVQIASNLTPGEIWQNNESLIPVCSTEPGASQENCVVFPSGWSTGPSPAGISSTQLGSNYQYFRTYFNESGSSTPLSYGSDIASELSLFGIYNSLYDDISNQNLDYLDTVTETVDSGGSYTFTNEYGIIYDYGTITLDDYEGTPRTFGAFIDLGCDPYLQQGTTGPGDGSQLCVDEINTTSSNTPVGCYDRPWMFPPTVSKCLNYSSCSYDSTSVPNISAQPRISVSVGGTTLPDGNTTAIVTGVIGVDIPSAAAPVSFCVLDDNHKTAQQVSNSATITTPANACEPAITTNNLSPCTLYQNNVFSAYITDSINYSIASDSTVINGTTTPYTSGEQYTGGMQYNNYIYCRGATQICLAGYGNSLKTVVTKMVGTTNSTTGTTTYSPSTILTDRIIPPYVPEETYPLANTSLYNASVNNYYSGASATNTYIGYYDSTAGYYVPGEGCPSTINVAQNGVTCCVSTDGTTCSTSQTVTTYPASLVCSCTTTTTPPSSYSCDSTICNTLYQEIITTAVDGTTTTSTTSIDGVTVSTTTATTSGSGSSTGGVVTYYQIAGNYTAYTTPNSDNMPSPWTNCKYSNGVTLCPVSDDDGNPLFGIRELTAMELDLCVDLLVPYCDAIDSTVGYTEDNGYATWNQTAAGTSPPPTGGCISPAKPSAAGQPTRSCNYQDATSSTAPSSNCTYTDPASNTYPSLAENCCPEYSQVWGTVTNPCVVSPPWWPGKFLAGNANLQGAIINQFNVAYDYRSAVNSSKYLTPTSANADPFNLFSGSYNTQYSSSSVSTTSGTNEPIAPEPWNSCYGSCQKNGIGTAANYARKVTDGDQEMLYLTQNQWFDLWNNNDMEWLLASPDTSANVGCYVYSLCTAFNSNGYCTTANMNANVAGITPAMKICMYQDNVSFALVDLGAYNSTTQTYANPTDYTNDRYLMQSNIVAYNAYIKNTGNVSVNKWCSSSQDTISSTSLTNNISDKTSVYDTRINNGIVVTRAGFGFTSVDYDNSGILPTGFVQYSTAESVNVGYNYANYSEGSHSYDCSCDGFTGLCGSCTGHSEWIEYNPSPYSSTLAPYCWSNTTNDKSVFSYNTNSTESGGNANTSTYYTTYNPLSIFRNNMTLSSAYSAANYLLNATDFANLKSYYYSPNNTSISVPQCDNDSNEEKNQCYLGVVVNSYTPGNSAANTAMFLWSSPTSYNVTNGSVSLGTYGQPSN